MTIKAAHVRFIRTCLENMLLLKRKTEQVNFYQKFSPRRRDPLLTSELYNFNIKKMGMCHFQKHSSFHLGKKEEGKVENQAIVAEKI